jgi:arylmalonate decarboxylase
VGIATAYTGDLNRALAAFLRESGYSVGGMKGLALTALDDARRTGHDSLRELAQDVFAEDPSVDALLLSCGGFSTLEIIPELEDRLGIPVVSSLPAGLWDVVHLAGCDPRAPHAGQLFVTRPDRLQPKATVGPGHSGNGGR